MKTDEEKKENRKTIARISKIKNYRIFQDFTWPGNLQNFKEKNLFYGWNGTGKSTLSSLFRLLEKGISLTKGEGEVEFVFSDDIHVAGAEFSSTQGLPQVRVFNKDFIAENVFTTEGTSAPIFFLGEENIGKQKQVEILKLKLKEINDEISKKEKEKHQSEKALDDFRREQAKSIKNMLTSSGGNNPYSSYDKGTYQRKSDELLKLSDTGQKAKILSDSDFGDLKKKKESHELEKLSILDPADPNTQEMTEKVVALLKKTVVSTVIETLKNDPDLSGWVKSGLSKHKNNDSRDCLFCGQPLPNGRIRELEAHFNDKYNEFIAEIENQSKIIKLAIDSLEQCTKTIPDPSRLYDHLKKDFEDRRLDFKTEIDRLQKYLENLLNALNDKAEKPFQSIERSFELTTFKPNVVSNLNEVIKTHNQVSKDFQKEIIEARIKIEESMIAGSLTDYREKKNEDDKLYGDLKEMSGNAKKFETDIINNERDIVEHRKPADELNADIRSYLGRDELTFKVLGSGYQISRNGKPAKNLSEGERTAIAFLYFLKSLGDKSFSLKDGIVVIDDPVSSLDSNAIFHAFGFMQDKTIEAGQLFILTHSHSFFRQVKNWFMYINKYKKEDMKPAKFYMLKSNLYSISRTSSISELDSLLYNYESEYHYLFSLVYDAVHSKKNANLKHNYYLPNIARRLLESFLAFRLPSMSGDLHKQLSQINFDNPKKKGIIRFLHTFSHNEITPGQEYDLSILSETKSILSDLLDLIKKEDERHFREMEELVNK